MLACLLDQSHFLRIGRLVLVWLHFFIQSFTSAQTDIAAFHYTISLSSASSSSNQPYARSQTGMAAEEEKQIKQKKFVARCCCSFTSFLPFIHSFIHRFLSSLAACSSFNFFNFPPQSSWKWNGKCQAAKMLLQFNQCAMMRNK